MSKALDLFISELNDYFADNAQIHIRITAQAKQNRFVVAYDTGCADGCHDYGIEGWRLDDVWDGMPQGVFDRSKQQMLDGIRLELGRRLLPHH